MEHVLICSQQVRNRLKHSRVEDLVYIYTNSRLLKHRRGPTPVQWYGLNTVHSDDDLDGDDQDDAKDQDLHEEGDDIDNNDVEPMDFDENSLDSDDSHSDGNDDGGDGDFAIYDFSKDIMIRSSEARHVHHEGPIDGAPFEVLSTEQGVRRDHGIHLCECRVESEERRAGVGEWKIDYSVVIFLEKEPLKSWKSGRLESKFSLKLTKKTPKPWNMPSKIVR